MVKHIKHRARVRTEQGRRRPASVVWIFLVAQALVAPFSLVGPLDSLCERMDFPVPSALGDPLKHALPDLLPRVLRGIPCLDEPVDGHHLGTAPGSPRPPPAA